LICNSTFTRSPWSTVKIVYLKKRLRKMGPMDRVKLRGIIGFTASQFRPNGIRRACRGIKYDFLTVRAPVRRCFEGAELNPATLGENLEMHAAKRRLPIGAETQKDGGVSFRVWAPRRNRVRVVLETGPGSPATVGLEREPAADGYYSGFCAEAAAGTI